MYVLKRNGVYLVLCLIMVYTTGCATTRPDRLKDGNEAVLYYNRGASAAQRDFSNTDPFLRGYVATLAAPIPILLFADEENIALSTLGGIGSILTIWGAKKFADNSMPRPKSSFYTMTEEQQRWFEKGYTEKVKKTINTYYTFGVAAGVMTEFVIVFYIVLHRLQNFS